MLSGTVALGLATIPVSTAEATDATARANWRAYALSELANMEALRAADIAAGDTNGDGNLVDDMTEAWSTAYQAELTAFKYGTWNNPETLTLLNKVYSLEKPGGGYGFEEDYDAFQDGSKNLKSTIYTVTNTDHVGEPLLEGYKQGVVPRSKVESIVNRLMTQPVISTPNGKCLLYSNNPNDANWCVLNVSLGAAGFLQKAYDAGIQVPGQLTLVNDLKPLIVWSYEKGVEEISADAQGVNQVIIKQGFWPYAYEKTTGTWQFSRDSRAQDWNHNAYMAENAIYLGISQGTNSINNMLDFANYRNPKINRTAPYERVATDAREVQGRMRIQGVKPTRVPKNMWQDATFYSDNYTNRAITDYAQGGRWAARMAGNALSDTEVAHTVDFITTPKSYVGSKLYTGNPSVVPSGSKVTLRADVRQTVNLDSYRVYRFIVKKPVQLLRNGVLVETKTSGIDGNIAFVYTVTGNNNCFVFRVAGEKDSNQKCVNVS